MSDFYCGFGKIPHSKDRRGTFEECMGAKQLRLYGLRKVSNEQLHDARERVGTNNYIMSLGRSITKLTAEINEANKKGSPPAEILKLIRKRAKILKELGPLDVTRRYKIPRFQDENLLEKLNIDERML